MHVSESVKKEGAALADEWMKRVFKRFLAHRHSDRDVSRWASDLRTWVAQGYCP